MITAPAWATMGMPMSVISRDIVDRSVATWWTNPVSWCDDILRHAPAYRVNPDLFKALDEVPLEYSLIRGRGCGTVFVSPFLS